MGFYPLVKGYPSWPQLTLLPADALPPWPQLTPLPPLLLSSSQALLHFCEDATRPRMETNHHTFCPFLPTPKTNAQTLLQEISGDKHKPTEN